MISEIYLPAVAPSTVGTWIHAYLSFLNDMCLLHIMNEVESFSFGMDATTLSGGIQVENSVIHGGFRRETVVLSCSR